MAWIIPDSTGKASKKAGHYPNSSETVTMSLHTGNLLKQIENGFKFLFRNDAGALFLR